MEGVIIKYRINEANWNTVAPLAASWEDDTGRHRKFFKTKQAAQKWINDQNDEVKAFGSAAISDELRIEALKAEDMLEGSGATVLDAVREYVARKNISKKSVQFHELFIQVLRHTGGQVYKEERSVEHFRGIKKVGKRMDLDFGTRIVSEIEKHEIVKWLQSLDHLTAASKDYYRRYATSIFTYACTLGWCAKNPCHGIPKEAHKGDIGILTPAEAQSLLNTCHPTMRMFYAVGCFAGLRPMSELLALTWDDINLEERLINVKNTKTRNHSRSARERYVQISDNLFRWIQGYAGERGGTVSPGNWRDYVYGSRGNRSIHFASDREKAGIKRWSHDCMRHSFASYHYAKYGDASKLAEQLGHTSTNLIFSNYRRRVKPSEAEAFWNIYPSE